MYLGLQGRDKRDMAILAKISLHCKPDRGFASIWGNYSLKSF